ncbi:MAG: hypothetical protein NTZ90_06415 [Proteobacteria bacterium]|nr:hypothetical protein [Pseudomonadota bacterium]
MGTSFKLQNGLLLLSTEAPGGVYNAEQLKKLAALCASEDAVAKATEDQRLALFVPPAKAAAVAAQLKSVGLGVRHYQDGLHQPINCLGALCGEHLQDAMGSSMDLADELTGIVLDQPLKIGINGCARCCLATHTLDISIIGDTGGYRVSLGGKNSQLPEMASFMAEGVPAAKLPKLIAKVVSVYKKLAQSGESLQEVMERAGTQEFIATLAPYSQDAAHSDPFGDAASTPETTAADSSDELKIDEFAGDEAFDAPGIDAAISTEGLDAEPSFDDSDLGMSELESGPEASDELSLESTDTGLVSSADEEKAFDTGLVEDSGDELPPLIADEELGELSLESTPDVATSGETLAAAEDEFAVDDLSMDPVAPAADEFAAEDGDFAVAEPILGDLEIEDEFAPEPISAGPAPTEFAAGEDELGLDELEESVDLATDPDLEEESLSVAPVETKPIAKEPIAPAAKPQVSAPTLVAGDDEMIADEIAEADADAFEEKLSASIAEEGAFGEIEDANSSDRMATMELVTSAPEEEFSAPASDELAVDALDDELSFETTETTEVPEPTEVGETIGNDLPASDELELAEDAEISADDISDLDLAPAPAQIPERPVPAVAKDGPRAVPSVKGFEFTGLDITSEGKIALQFASGAAVEIDPGTLVLSGRRELKLAGKSIVLVPRKGGVNVEVDGVAIFVPNQGKAAA